MTGRPKLRENLADNKYVRVACNDRAPLDESSQNHVACYSRHGEELIGPFTLPDLSEAVSKRR